MRWTKTFRATLQTWRTRGLTRAANTRKVKMLCKRLLDDYDKRRDTDRALSASYARTQKGP
jgi:hypothetical protein